MTEQASKRTEKPAIYGRASTFDGQRATITAERRDAYERSAARLLEAARAGQRRLP